jgi:1,4-alpha-glucan branching enzyme
VHHLNYQDKVIGFHRWDRGGVRDDVVVIANFADRAYPDYRIGLPRAGLWRVRFNSDWTGYSGAFRGIPSYDSWSTLAARDTMPCEAGFGLGPYTCLILSQDQ